MPELNRLTRTMAAEYIGCSLSTFDRLLREGYLKGTYFELFSRKYFFTSRLDDWMLNGGIAQLNKKGGGE